jgi:hypothetical protein
VYFPPYIYIRGEGGDTRLDGSDTKRGGGGSAVNIKKIMQ